MGSILVEVAGWFQSISMQDFRLWSITDMNKPRKKEKQDKDKGSGLKEIRIRPRVQEHDLETKIRLAKKLLDDGDKVKLNVVFRGREITHPELGLKALQKMTDGLKDVAGIDGSPSLEGRMMNLVLTPISSKQKKLAKVKEEGTVAKT